MKSGWKKITLTLALAGAILFAGAGTRALRAARAVREAAVAAQR